MKMKPIYNKFTDEIVNDYIEYMKYNDLPSQISIDSLDLPHIIGKIQHQQKEIQRLNNIINTLEDSIVGKINVLYQVKGQSNAIQELNILLRQLRELKGEDKE